MSKKMMLLALAAVSVAMFSLPAAASAGGYTVHPGGQAFAITGVPGYWSTVGGDTINCNSKTGGGAYNAAGTGGTLQFTFHGCTAFGFSCNSSNPAQPAGTIQTTPLTFSNVFLNHQKKLGFTIGPSTVGGALAHISCPFTTITWTGSVLGEVENLTCNAATTKTIALNFERKEAKHGIQKFNKVTETGVEEHLTLTKNGAPSTMAWTSTETMNFVTAVGPTC